MRFGDYEVLRCNQWCYQLYAVQPEGFDNSKAKYRLAADGRALKPLDCYPSTLAAGIRRIADFIERDGVEPSDELELAAARMERLRDEVSAEADRLQALVEPRP